MQHSGPDQCVIEMADPSPAAEFTHPPLPSPHMQARIAVLTGAGVSAESGIPTFRVAGGLWEGHRIEDVATPEAWRKDPERVLRFYNERRASIRAAQPNAAHLALAKLEGDYSVDIITQNIDDLHERAGSTRVLHLHGEILKARSTADPSIVLSLGTGDIALGQKCRRGSQLRPHIVWFGEAVPLIDAAAEIVGQADNVIVIGTSMNVYPAAGLLSVAKPSAKRYFIDPHIPDGISTHSIECIAQPASVGVPQLVSRLLGEAAN